MDRAMQQDLLQLLSVSRQDAKENFIWNSIVLKHEAKNLGVEPTDDEVFEAIQSMPIFPDQRRLRLLEIQQSGRRMRSTRAG